MAVSDRLREYCKVHRITQDHLVNKGFGTKQTINNYINGKTEPKANFLEKFILEFRLSAAWLMTGNEDAPSPGHKDNEANKECEELLQRIEELKEKLSTVQEKYTMCLEELLSKKGNHTANSA